MIAMRTFHRPFYLFYLFLAISPAFSQGNPEPVPTIERSAPSPAIVIGFVGGFVKHDDPVHSGVQLAASIRKEHPAGVYVEVFENRRRESAHQTILRLLDANHDGTMSEEEKRNARIIIYGHSWGASETVTLARELQTDGVGVLLTVQVDSVSKAGEVDSVIPPNVARAVNFYQPNGIIHGQGEIRAADTAHTQILGNFRFNYEENPVRCNQYPWYDRFFYKTHTEIECDPKVWNQVGYLIRSELPRKE
jgi:hypothetical protein